MAESESAALPLGYTPTYPIQVAGVPGLEPGKWRDQNPLPYRLAIPLRVSLKIRCRRDNGAHYSWIKKAVNKISAKNLKKLKKA